MQDVLLIFQKKKKTMKNYFYGKLRHIINAFYVILF